MNREGRRKIVKAAKRGAQREKAKKIIDVIENGAGETTIAQPVNTGDKVKLNIEAIKARKNYDSMSELYRAFVEESEDTVFTAVVEREKIVHLEEEPKWLFWCGDLNVVERVTP